MRAAKSWHSVENPSLVNAIKDVLKTRPRLYSRAVSLLGPVYDHQPLLKPFLRSFGTPDGAVNANLTGRAQRHPIVMNFGAGTSRVEEGVLNVDRFPFDGTRLVADVQALPLRDGSIDGAMSVALLEHVHDPQGAVDEFHRVLKTGGRIYSLVPFLQPYHPSPRDYYRWTLEGLERLHSAFRPLALGPCAGPASSLTWLLIEFLSMALSFNSERLRLLLWALFGGLLGPVKYLDWLLLRHRAAHVLASTIAFYGEKPAVAVGTAPASCPG